MIMLTTQFLGMHRLVNEDDPLADNSEFLIAVMAATYEARRGQMETVNALPLYPTETILWDENVIPSVHYTGMPQVWLVSLIRQK
jgi:hypothetical protein